MVISEDFTEIKENFRGEMNDMGLFEKIIVIGYGKIAGDVLKYVIARKNDYSYGIEYIEHELNDFSIVKTICDRYGISYFFLTKKEEVLTHLKSELKQTLVISAGNHYIFPKCIVEQDNITIINFHNALLPKYPGRNAPTWAIYYGESESGATWHYVNEQIDAGKIIWQKECFITEDMKAYELTGKIMELAFAGLQENFDYIMKNEIRNNIQYKPCIQKKIYYSYEMPDDGKFNISDNVDNIYKLLRATDYGKSGIFPNIRTDIPDIGEVEITSYRKIQLRNLSDNLFQLENTKRIVYLFMRDGNALRLKYRKVKNKEV